VTRCGACLLERQERRKAKIRAGWRLCRHGKKAVREHLWNAEMGRTSGDADGMPDDLPPRDQTPVEQCDEHRPGFRLADHAPKTNGSES
jgi:hypothetical protein